MDRDASWEREHPRGVDPDEGLAGSLRDAPPDPFAPIDPGAPVSGHIPAPEAAGHPGSHAPEQEWSVAVRVLGNEIEAAHDGEGFVVRPGTSDPSPEHLDPFRRRRV